jgi:sodium/proline symporter
MPANLSITIIFIILIYFSFLAFLGVRGYKNTHTFKDYILGGRKLGPVLGAMNVGASDMSSWLLMGLPGAFYLYGMNQIWMIIGLIMGSYASWKLIAARLRVYTELAGDSLTISSFLENRFNDTTRTLRIVTAIMILFFFTIYIASGFVGSAKLFSSIFHISYRNGLIISIIVIIFYALLGGFLAVSWADLLQGTLMLFTLLMVPIGMMFHMGGLTHITGLVHQVSASHFNPFYNLNFLGIIGLMGWGLGYFGQPHIISKYMAIKNVSDIKNATRICITWMTISMISAALVGFFGVAFFANKPLAAHETVFIIAANNIFPAAFMGFVISAILAAIMSTINGQLLISCGTISEDFYKRFFRKNAGNKELLLVTRFFIVCLAFITFFIAKNEESTVLGLVSYAWSGLGAAIGPIIICSLFIKRTTKLAAIIGVISGGVASIIFSEWKVFSHELFPAFTISFALITLVSFFQKIPPSVEVEEIFKKF